MMKKVSWVNTIYTFDFNKTGTKLMKSSALLLYLLKLIWKAKSWLLDLTRSLNYNCQDSVSVFKS